MLDFQVNHWWTVFAGKQSRRGKGTQRALQTIDATAGQRKEVPTTKNRNVQGKK